MSTATMMAVKLVVRAVSQGSGPRKARPMPIGDGDRHDEEPEHPQPVHVDVVEEVHERPVEQRADGHCGERGIEHAAVLQARRQVRHDDGRTGADDDHAEEADRRVLHPAAGEDVVDGAEGDDRCGDEGDHATLRAAAERTHPEQPHGHTADDDRPPGFQGRIVDEVVDVDRTILLEQHRYPEDGQRIEEERDEGDEVVEARVLANRRDHTHGDAEDDGNDRRGGDELDRVDDRTLELFGDLLA
jgi:hypothetical protein